MATDDGIKFENLNDIKDVLGKLGTPEIMDQVFERSIVQVANTILNDSKEIVPVLHGDLKRSGHLEPESGSARDGQDVYVSIVFGGSAAPYALAIHDGSAPYNIPNAWGRGSSFGLSGRFDGKFHPGMKGRFYLKIPFEEHQKDVKPALTKALNALFAQVSASG